MPKTRIHIISFAFLDHSFAEKIKNQVSKEFRTPVKLRQGHLDLSAFLDPTRRQYNGNEVLRTVDLEFSHSYKKVIGLFAVDLFIPILTFVFGQAYLNGKTGIASIYRLSPSRYGMPEDTDRLIDRTIKEVIHELGHTYGLIHCLYPGCVMNSSTYVEDIDQKTQEFCPNCQYQLFGNG